MNKHCYNKSALLFVVLSCSFFILYLINNIYSGSVDVAHVYSLIYRLDTEFILSSKYDPSLGEMNFYPPGSHIIAVIAGKVLGSPYLGMMFITYLATFCIWCFIFLILSFLPVKKFYATALFTTLLVLFFGFELKYPVHANEIISNFFYSQLVGFALCYVIIWYGVCLQLKYQVKNLTIFVYLFISSYALEYIHLIPAVLIFSLGLGLIFLDFLESKINNLKYWFLYPAIILLSAFLFYNNPAFQSMRLIADNDGSMDLGNARYPSSMILISIAVIFLSLVLLRLFYSYKRAHGVLVLKYLAVYGFAAASLCLLQYCLYHYFEIGSNYAVKKYYLVIDSILIIQLSILLSFYISRIKIINTVLNFICNHKRSGYALISIAVLPLLILLPLFHGKYVYDYASNIVKYENDIRHLVKLSDYPADKMIVKGLNKNTLEYMFSTAIMRVPREIALPESLLKNNVNYALFQRVIDIGDMKNSQCAISHYGSATLLDTKCLSLQVNKCNQLFDFSDNKLIMTSVLRNGFGDGENTGRWTNNTNATFECNNDAKDIKEIVINFRPFITEKVEKQRLKVFINGKNKGEFVYNDPSDASIILPIAEVSQSPILKVSFEIPDAKSPKELGLNPDDDRKLGFFFKNIEVR